MSWERANKYCANVSAHLVSIANIKEEQLIKQLFLGEFATAVYIGLQQKGKVSVPLDNQISYIFCRFSNDIDKVCQDNKHVI